MLLLYRLIVRADSPEQARDLAGANRIHCTVGSTAMEDGLVALDAMTYEGACQNWLNNGAELVHFTTVEEGASLSAWQN